MVLACKGADGRSWRGRLEIRVWGIVDESQRTWHVTHVTLARARLRVPIGAQAKDDATPVCRMHFHQKTPIVLLYNGFLRLAGTEHSHPRFILLPGR